MSAIQSADSRARICPACGSEIGLALLVCPACGQLAHSVRLKELAAEAEAARHANDPRAALVAWRAALDLLPPESRQYARIAQTIADLGREVDAVPKKAVEKKDGSVLKRWMAGAGALLLFLLAKGKLLLLGLTKASTFFSLFIALGAYWTAFGWKFAAGLIASTYVHEMGHVAWLRRYGIAASAPMFIPGLGAFVRLKQYPIDPREDSRIGLAGPMWGLGASVILLVVGELEEWPSWIAIAHVSAWINLFNLMPVWQLDGSRGIRSMSRTERWLSMGAVLIGYALCGDGFLLVLAAVAGWRALSKGAPQEGDRFALVQYSALVIALALVMRISHASEPASGF